MLSDTDVVQGRSVGGSVMSATRERILYPLAQMCRLGASALIAGVWRRQTLAEVESRIKALALRDQVAIVAGVLAVLLGLSIFAAQFGFVGILAFWLLVVILVN